MDIAFSLGQLFSGWKFLLAVYTKIILVAGEVSLDISFQNFPRDCIYLKFITWEYKVVEDGRSLRTAIKRLFRDV